MGSRLHELGAGLNQSYDYLNITKPQLVLQVHGEYLAAGADLIETNTFSANCYKLARFGLEEQVVEVNAAAVRLAKQAAAASGRQPFVAGSVGPLPGGLTDLSVEELTEEEMRRAFAQQIEALATAGVDLLILETFSELSQIKLALEEAKKIAGMPVVAQMTFPDGQHAPDGTDAYEALELLHSLGADVVGTNCGQGVAKVLKAIEYLGSRTNARLSAFANAGLPQRVGGRFMYAVDPAYIAESAELMAKAGANLIGGCCGTTAADIAAIAARLRGRAPERRTVVQVKPSAAAAAPAAPRALPDFLAKLGQKPVVLVELDAPRTTDLQKFLRSVSSLKAAGADAVTIGDSPLATLRMNGFMIAPTIERECEMPVVCHLACRDRNLIATQGLLLAAEAVGVRNILTITGDPAKLGDHPSATSVYDFNSFKLLELVAKMNAGQNLSGQNIGRPTRFTVGVAYNPNARNIDVEAARLAKKVQRGAQFAMTQAVFDVETLKRAVEAARPLGIPIFAGVYPLISHRNAEYLHNEFPGMTICQVVRDRMAAAAPDKPRMQAEGMAIARELIEQFVSIADGIYLIPPLNRAHVAVELMDFVKVAWAKRAGQVAGRM